MSNTQKSGSHSENLQAGRNITKLDIGQLLGINVETMQVIQLVLNVQGQGSGTLGESLSKLQPLNLPLPPLESPDIQGLIGEVQKSIQEHAVDVSTDLALLVEVLKTTVETESKKEHSLPGKFLSSLVSTIGAKLDDAGIFKSDFAYAYKDPISSRRNFAEIPMVTTTLAIIKSKDKKDVIWLKQTIEEEFQQRTLPAKGLFGRETVENAYYAVAKYRLECNEKSIVADGGYHIKLETMEKQSPDLLSLSPVILAKVTRALLHDFLGYMRYPEGTKKFIESLSG